MLDSVIKLNKKYYPQTLLEECKYEIKNRINIDFDPSSFDSEINSEPNSELDSETNTEPEKSSKKSDHKSDRD